jgi:hypothetical protein
VRRTAVIGNVEKYSTRALAEAAVNGLRMQINEDRLRQPEQLVLVGDLVDHYMQTELCDETTWHSHATRIVYREFLTRWIRPHWGRVNIRSVRTVAVEHWLRLLQRRNGNPLANTTKAKIRSLLSVLFNHAIRYEWLGQGKKPDYLRHAYMKPIGGLAKSSFSRLGPHTDWQREALGGCRSDWLRSVQNTFTSPTAVAGRASSTPPQFPFSVLTKVSETGPSNARSVSQRGQSRGARAP